MITTVMVRAAARSALSNLRESCRPYTYSMMLSVSGSIATKYRISQISTSAPMPVEIMLENTKDLLSAQYRIAVHRAPDCEMTAMRPRLA